MREARLDNLRRSAKEGRRRVEQLGPGACGNCGEPACGHLWPEDECCSECTHDPAPGWEPTHVIVSEGHEFLVMVVAVGELLRLCVRADGVIEWVEAMGEVFFHGARPTRCAIHRLSLGTSNQAFNRLEENEWEKRQTSLVGLAQVSSLFSSEDDAGDDLGDDPEDDTDEDIDEDDDEDDADEDDDAPDEDTDD